MTDPQWQDLLRVIRGELLAPLPAGLIIDCPWLPGWAGATVLDYFADERVWLDANFRAVDTFPDIWMLPGFWAEYGMCTEPSAFGAKCIWTREAFPNVQAILHDYAEIDRLKKPNCRTDGLLPFVVRRMERCREAIEARGHRYRFATARGPMNIATYLIGHTEFLIGVKTHPAEMHRLMNVVTDFLVDWIAYQMDSFDTIDGIFLLDDLIGFLGDADFQEFALPYLKRIYDVRDVSVRFLHNDAMGMVTAKHLAALRVNLFNHSFNHSLADMRKAAGDGVTLLAGVPPLDVLANGTPEDVRRSLAAELASMVDRRWVILSSGGGTPPNTPTANIAALRSLGPASQLPYSSRSARCKEHLAERDEYVDEGDTL